MSDNLKDGTNNVPAVPALKGANGAKMSAKEAAAHVRAQKAADAEFAESQTARAVKLISALRAEESGAIAGALAVGDVCWDYFDAAFARAGNCQPATFTASAAELRALIRPALGKDADPNVSRYLKYAALARVWDRDKVLAIGVSIAQQAAKLIELDKTAPALAYKTPGRNGMESFLAFQFVPAWEKKARKLLEDTFTRSGTCDPITLATFTSKRDRFCKAPSGADTGGDSGDGPTGPPEEVSKAAKQIRRALDSAGAECKDPGKARAQRAQAVELAVQKGGFTLADIKSAVAGYADNASVEQTERVKGLADIRAECKAAMEAVKAKIIAALEDTKAKIKRLKEERAAKATAAKPELSALPGGRRKNAVVAVTGEEEE